MDKTPPLTWVVDAKDEGVRLLTFVKNRVDFSTKDVRWAIDHQRCAVNGLSERFGSRRLAPSDRVEIHLDKRPAFRFERLRKLYEDDFLYLYNKPAGIPTNGEWSLASLLKLLVVHRLDRDTTGVTLFAKNEEIQKSIEDLFRNRQVEKSYLAIVCGAPKKKEGIIEGYMGKISQKEGEVKMGMLSPPHGSYANTQYIVEKESSRFSLIRLFPKTGRTHQIRLHLSSIGHPILGDRIYGSRHFQESKGAFRPLLHAESIAFLHPITQQKLSVEAPLPADFKDALTQLTLI